tara:strand:+ start:100 stop:225 length:126 start_codon:yes stop_codon:yes gene_type:complete
MDEDAPEVIKFVFAGIILAALSIFAGMILGMGWKTFLWFAY